MNVSLNLFPGGRYKAMTMSYDDGVTQDRKLIDLFNKYGIKGTFNLNSGMFGNEDSFYIKDKKAIHNHVSKEEVASLYEGHETAVHTVTHPFLERLPKELVLKEVLEDKENIEDLVGYPVRGMAYPYGTYNADVIEVLKAAGIEYSRTVNSHGLYKIPDKYLEWDPTAHHLSENLMKTGRDFVELNDNGKLNLLYVWGHSYELDVFDKWGFMEEFLKLTGGRKDIWYATNIEILDYINALKSLKFSVGCKAVYNPTAIDVWIKAGNDIITVKSGETVIL